MTEDEKIATERRKGYMDLVQSSKKYLVDQGIQGTALTGDVRIFLENKTLDPMNSKQRSYALFYLTTLEQQLLDQGPDSLTPGQKAFIASAWNTWGWNQGATAATPGAPGAGAPAGGGAAAGGGAPGGAPPAPERPPGAPSAETGMTQDQEWTLYRQMRKNLYATKVQEALNMTYGAGYSPTPDELKMIKKSIKKYVDERLGPSMWKNWAVLANEPIE